MTASTLAWFADIEKKNGGNLASVSLLKYDAGPHVFALQNVSRQNSRSHDRRMSREMGTSRAMASNIGSILGLSRDLCVCRRRQVNRGRAVRGSKLLWLIW